MSANEHSGHRERLKRRFLQNESFAGFEEHNILEMLLFYAIAQKDTNALSHRLIKRFGSLSGVFEAPYEALLEVEGISHSTATLIKMVLPLLREYNKKKSEKNKVLGSTEAIAEFLMQSYMGYTEEVFSVLCLDNRYRLINFRFLEKGSADKVLADTRVIVKMLLESKARVAVICHNHPGGLALPSLEDIEVTKKIKTMLEGVNVELLDHIIVADDDCVSLRESVIYGKIFEN